jgi:hypothetical protein
MATKAKPKLTPAQQREARIAELDAVQQMQLADQQRRLEAKAASDASMLEIQQGRAARQAAKEAGNYEPPTVPTINEVFQAKAAEERAAAEEAERQRIAALDPHAVLYSALPIEKKQFIDRWRAANPGVQFPFEALTMH